jgi:hypothetical protein
VKAEDATPTNYALRIIFARLFAKILFLASQAWFQQCTICRYSKGRTHSLASEHLRSLGCPTKPVRSNCMIIIETSHLAKKSKVVRQVLEVARNKQTRSLWNDLHPTMPCASFNKQGKALPRRMYRRVASRTHSKGKKKPILQSAQRQKRLPSVKRRLSCSQRKECRMFSGHNYLTTVQILQCLDPQCKTRTGVPYTK